MRFGKSAFEIKDGLSTASTNRGVTGNGERQLERSIFTSRISWSRLQEIRDVKIDLSSCRSPLPVTPLFVLAVERPSLISNADFPNRISRRDQFRLLEAGLAQEAS